MFIAELAEVFGDREWTSECDCVAASSKLTTVKTETKDIWTEDEVTAGAEYDDVDDPRQQPQLVTIATTSSSSSSSSSSSPARGLDPRALGVFTPENMQEMSKYVLTP